MKNAFYYTFLAVIVLMHCIGLYGILYGDRHYYIGLTWVNLLVTGLCFLAWSAVEQRKKAARYFAAFMLVFLAGFLVEVAGVKTGSIFGHYHYGVNLGYRLWDVPLIIGLNWGLLLFACAGIVSRAYSNFWVKATVGASLMTLLDYLIEPVAMYFDYWTWQQETIPVQNFMAWWLVSFAMFALCFAFVKNMQNRLGIWVYGIQLVFFTLLNLLLK